jgi:TRAP-type C4-dicarboxylate transport system substrate-binding protein
MKGLKIGGFGRWIPKWVSAAGATPVSVSAGELYTAFQKGTIDGRVFGIATVKQFGLQEVAKYMNLVGFGSWPLQAVLTINEDVWSTMPPDLRATITEVGKEAEEMGPKLIMENEDKLIQSFKKQGMQFLEISKADKEEWKNLPEVRALPGMWVKEAEAKGFPGKRIMDMWLDLQGWK